MQFKSNKKNDLQKETSAVYLGDNRKNGLDVIVMAVFFLLLPLDTALSNFLFGISLLDYIALLYVLICPFYKFSSRGFYKQNSIVYVYICYIFLTIFWSNDMFYLSNIMFAYYALFFCLIIGKKYNWSELKLLGKAIYCSIFLVLLMYLFFSVEIEGRVTIKIFNIVDPNFFTTSLCIGSGFLIDKIYKKKKYIIVNVLLLLAIVAIIFQSGSRGGLLTLASVFAFYVFICFRHKKRYLILFMVLAVALYFIALEVLPKEWADRFSILGSVADGGSGRVTIWKNMLKIYSDGNIVQKIFGYGRESCGLLYYAMTSIRYFPHNIFIKTLVEGGLLGLVLLIAVFYVGWKRAYVSDNRFVFCVIGGFLIGSCFLDMDNTRIFWIVLFIIFNIKKENSKYETKPNFTSI